MNGFISGTHTHTRTDTKRISRWFRLAAANILAAALADGSLGYNQLSATITGFCSQSN